MKKLLAFLFLFTFLNVSNASFTDVKWDTLYKDGINLLQENQIVKGYADGSFGIQNDISRSEMLKILIESKFLIENLDTQILEDYQTQSCFNDVSSSDWFAKYVCWAKDNQWISGYNDGTEFRPNNSVTLVEGLKMMLKSGNLEYPETERWYKGVVDKASQDNLIPFDSEYFHHNLRRDQMADMIARLIHFNSDTLDDYLADRKEFVVSWDTLKVRNNFLNQYSTPCMTPNYFRMIHQTLFNFYNQEESCISIAAVYNNSLDEIDSPEYDLIKYKEYEYFTVFYKSNIPDQAKIDSILSQLTYYDDDQDQFDKNAKLSDYNSMNGVYYINLPVGFKNFNVQEFPVYKSENTQDVPFEDQKNSWRIEAEDRFDLEACNQYNFPAFMMFKIKTFYEYCQELRTQGKVKDNDLSQSQIALNQQEDEYCDSDPVQDEEGNFKFPIRDEYLNLGILGQIFTAHKCSEERLEQFPSVQDSTYQNSLSLELNQLPDGILIDLLQVLGFQCQSPDLQAQECLVFETKEPEITIESLIQLENYSEIIQSSK